MNEDNDEILDYREETPPRAGLIKTLFATAILTLGYWFVADSMNWPHKSWGLFLGLILLAVITIIRFIYKRQPALFEIAYFIGKLILIAGIFVSFMGFPHRYYYIIAAAVFFFVGVVIPGTSSKES